MLSPEPMYQRAPVSWQVMRGTGAEMQMVSWEAEGIADLVWGQGQGQVPEKTLLGWGQGWGLWAGWAHCCGHGLDPLPTRCTENPLSWAQKKLVSCPGAEGWEGGGGRGRQLGAAFSKSFCSSFIPPYLHPGFPRKARFSHCTRRPL